MLLLGLRSCERVLLGLRSWERTHRCSLRCLPLGPAPRITPQEVDTRRARAGTVSGKAATTKQQQQQQQQQRYDPSQDLALDDGDDEDDAAGDEGADQVCVRMCCRRWQG
jgi:hypothetical protein